MGHGYKQDEEFFDLVIAGETREGIVEIGLNSLGTTCAISYQHADGIDQLFVERVRNLDRYRFSKNSEPSGSDFFALNDYLPTLATMMKDEPKLARFSDAIGLYFWMSVN